MTSFFLFLCFCLFERVKQVLFLCLLARLVCLVVCCFFYLSGVAGNTAGHCPMICRRGNHVIFFFLLFFFLRQLSRFISLFVCLFVFYLSCCTVRRGNHVFSLSLVAGNTAEYCLNGNHL